MIVIVNYGMGNLGSVLKSLNKLNVDAKISESIDDIKNASKIILPGVGNFSMAIQRLNELGYINILNKKVMTDKTPILGICLGMQLFANFSHEGNVKGLCWIDAEIARFDVNDRIKWKVPHIGWNTTINSKNNILLDNNSNDHLYYFVHSYHMICKDENDILAITDYCYEFPSVVQKNNIYGVQFHPEKSHRQGLLLLENFVTKT